jgi:type IV pilus assembly protein PilE
MRQKILTVMGFVAMFGIAYVLYLVMNPHTTDRLREEWQVEAKATLNYVCNLQATHFEAHGVYSMDLEKLGFMQQEGDGASFWVEIGRADSVEFIARAIAIKDFDRDGQMNMWEIRKDCKLVEIVED